MSKRIAIIAGVGPGTGAAIAHKFATAYPVVLLSRSSANTSPVVDEITKAGGSAIGVEADVSDAKSVQAVEGKVKQEWGEDVTVAAAIFNASGPFVRKPFLELTEEDLEKSWSGTVKGAFNFSQLTLPLLTPPPSTTTQTSSPSPSPPPTLIFTGATASIKGSALFASFATSKFALRALSQSLAREYGPKGVHVAHVIIDGVIDIERTKGWDLGEEGKIVPTDIAEAYWFLHGQGRTGWTWEVDLRPARERW